MGTANSGTELTSTGPTVAGVASKAGGNVDLITADTYLSMLTVMEAMLQHTHTVKDYYWSNCECQCGGGGTT